MGKHRGMGEQKRERERERERERGGSGGMIDTDIESVNWRDKESGAAYNGRR